MTLRPSLAVPTLWAALLSSGCMTAVSQLAYVTGKYPDHMVEPGAVVYGGTRIHFDGRGGHGMFDGDAWRAEPVAQTFWTLFTILDVPLSLCADTVLLPVTLLERATMREPEAPAPAEPPAEPYRDAASASPVASIGASGSQPPPSAR